MKIDEVMEREEITYHDKVKLKLMLDFEHLRIERWKAWGTILSIFIPLFVGAISIYYGVSLEEKRARANFELRSLEIVMTATTPEAATNKAIVLYELFPDRLSRDFKDKMLRMYGNNHHGN